MQHFEQIFQFSAANLFAEDLRRDYFAYKNSEVFLSEIANSGTQLENNTIGGAGVPVNSSVYREAVFLKIRKNYNLQLIARNNRTGRFADFAVSIEENCFRLRTSFRQTVDFTLETFQKGSGVLANFLI